MTMEDFEMDFDNRHPCLRWNLSEEQEAATARDGGFMWLVLPGQRDWTVFIMVPAIDFTISVGISASLEEGVAKANELHDTEGTEVTLVRAATSKAHRAVDCAHASDPNRDSKASQMRSAA